MNTNDKIGLNTSITQKNILELEKRLNSAVVDFDFYSTPFEFTSVEPFSVRNNFGSKWKKIVSDALGQDILEKYQEKYGNKGIDFKIVALHTPQARYFMVNETVEIKDEKGNYSATTKVVFVDSCYIAVMIPFTCDSKGTVVNVNRKNGAQKAITKMKQMLLDLKPSETKEKIEVKPETTTTKEQPTTNNNQQPINNNQTPATNDNAKKIKTLVFILLAIVLVLGAYQIFKPKK